MSHLTTQVQYNIIQNYHKYRPNYHKYRISYTVVTFNHEYNPEYIINTTSVTQWSHIIMT